MTESSNHLTTIETRLASLAKQKAKLELINRMLIRLSSVSGMENVSNHILTTLMETIGCANLILCYGAEGKWHFRTSNGKDSTTVELGDQRVIRALDTMEPLLLNETYASSATQTWVFPLISRGRPIGAVVMEGMFLTDQSIFQELLPFFTYAALMLDNEISNYNQLAEAHQSLQEAEERYRTLFEQSPYGITLVDQQTMQIIQFNQATHVNLGYTREEFARLSIMDFEARDNQDEILERRNQLHDQGRISFESVHRTKTGEERNVVVDLQLISIAGRPTAISIFHDITEEKQAAIAIKENERRYRLLANNIKDVVWQLDTDMRFTYISPSDEQLRGFRADEVLGRPAWEIMTPASATRIRELAAARRLSIDQGESPGTMTIEIEELCKDGSTLWVETKSTPVFGDDGQFSGFVGTSRDISERRKMEEVLRQTEELFRLFLEHSPVYTFIKDEDLKVTRVSRNFEQMVGKPLDQIIGKGMEELFPPELARNIIRDDRSVLATGQVVQVDEDLGEHSYTTIKFPFQLGDRKYLGGYTIDITPRKRAEEALKKSEEIFRLAFENANTGMCLVNTTGILLRVNRKMTEIFGYSREELEGMLVHALAVPEDQNLSREFITKTLKNELDNATFEKHYYHKDGHVITGLVSSSLVRDASGNPDYFISQVVDLTELRKAQEERLKLERQLLHTQKLESLGVLAGGIAHDFNNLLAAILGNLDLAQLRLPLSSPVRDNIAQSILACQRAADLTRQMLAYSGKGAFQMKKINLNDIVMENSELFRTVIPRNVSLNVATETELPDIEADPGQIQQVVMNLITNAAEAIGSRPGIISLNTGVVACDAAMISQSRLEEKPLPGEFVFVEVSDNGCGMEPETLSRLFEPFFTTKFTGRGLGMAATQGIVKTHKGAILLESEPDRGSSFKILFPSAGHTKKTAELPETDNSAANSDGKSFRGVVLVVDDEDYIRSLCGEYVRMLGFEPLEAADGHEAVELFRLHTGTVAFVILDLTMPNMDGVATLKELRKITPEARIMLSSGYSEQVVVDQFLGEKPDCFIQKPFQFKELEQKIKVLLGDGPA
jgi:PAS domain S-box-containing protein